MAGVGAQAVKCPTRCVPCAKAQLPSGCVVGCWWLAAVVIDDCRLWCTDDWWFRRGRESRIFALPMHVPRLFVVGQSTFAPLAVVGLFLAYQLLKGDSHTETVTWQDIRTQFLAKGLVRGCLCWMWTCYPLG